MSKEVCAEWGKEAGPFQANYYINHMGLGNQDTNQTISIIPLYWGVQTRGTGKSIVHRNASSNDIKDVGNTTLRLLFLDPYCT